jgi:hypothetical protein
MNVPGPRFTWNALAAFMFCLIVALSTIRAVESSSLLLDAQALFPGLKALASTSQFPRLTTLAILLALALAPAANFLLYKAGVMHLMQARLGNLRRPFQKFAGIAVACMLILMPLFLAGDDTIAHKSDPVWALMATNVFALALFTSGYFLAVSLSIAVVLASFFSFGKRA